MARKIALLPMVFLLGAMVYAVRFGIADLYAIRPAGAFDERPMQRPADLVSALKRIERAHQLDSGNPAHLENLARLHAWLAEEGNGAEDREALLDKAQWEIGEALRLRPVSPYAWDTLLRIKQEQGKVDSEFLRALDSATRLGPWEPEVQRLVAEAGLDAWSRLPEPQQNEVLQDVVRGYQRQADKMIQIVLKPRQGCASTTEDRQNDCP